MLLHCAREILRRARDDVNLMKQWLKARAEWIDSQFVPAPVLSPTGGTFGSPTNVTMTPKALATFSESTIMGASFPVQYLGANIPQARAAGAILHLIRTLLGLRADAPNRRLYVAPALPHWLPDLTLGGLRCGDARLNLRFWREGELSRWEILGQEGQIEVLDEPT